MFSLKTLLYLVICFSFLFFFFAFCFSFFNIRLEADYHFVFSFFDIPCIQAEADYQVLKVIRADGEHYVLNVKMLFLHSSTARLCQV